MDFEQPNKDFVTDREMQNITCQKTMKKERNLK